MSWSEGHQYALLALSRPLGLPPPCSQPRAPFYPPGAISLRSSDAPAVLPSSSPQLQPRAPLIWTLTDTYFDLRPTSSPWTHLVITGPSSWPWPAARLPGFQNLELPCHHTLVWRPELWAEAGCHLWVCPVGTGGTGLACCFPAQLAWHHAQLSALPPSGSSQPLLHPDVKGGEVFN